MLLKSNSWDFKGVWVGWLRAAVCRLSRCSSARGLFKEEESPKRTRAAQGPAWPLGGLQGVRGSAQFIRGAPCQAYVTGSRLLRGM